MTIPITIDNRPKSMRQVEKALKEWNYNEQKATAYSISKKTGLGLSTVSLRLRELRDQGKVIKSKLGSYFLKKREE